MAKILVIVESPAKCSKISQILNSIDKDNKYIVKASMGHVRDLPHNKFGININSEFNKFDPDYEIITGKGVLVKDLKCHAKGCDSIILATDLDREGEGIASHLAHILNLKNPKRIVFSEITKTAIKKALDNPISINKEMVSAYETRRLLDRIIGYKLSPVVKKNITDSFDTKISAGRTQSVVLKLICDKEDEINKFESSGYYSVNGYFEKDLNSVLNNRIENKEVTLEFLEKCKTATFTVGDVRMKIVQNKPPVPYITSSMQQDANTKLKMPIAVSQMLAQKLYEGGYVTYIRSDSSNIAEEFLPTIENYITSKFGEEYLDIKQQSAPKKTKKAVETQDAHECIRPTNLNITVDDIPDEQQARLYDMIYKRTIASQMKNKKINRTTITINISNVEEHKFITEEDITIFKGYTIIYDPDSELEESELKWIKKGIQLLKEKIIANEKFTQPPPRYTESTIIKDLEKKGIGRPSTYVTSYQTNVNRNYIIKSNKAGKKRKCYTITLSKSNMMSEVNKEQTVSAEKNKLYSTDIGRIVNKFLNENFSDVINYDFTALMEKQLDNIANKKNKKDNVLSEFYRTFYPKIKKYENNAGNKKHLGDYKEKPIYLCISKYGPMLQWGEYDKSKPKPFATSISDEQYESLSLQGSIKMIESRSKYPIELGLYKKNKVMLCKGPYGLYLKHNGTNFKIIEEKEVTLAEAKDIIDKKIDKEFPKTLGKLNRKDIKLCTGPYGLYLKYNNKNIKIPSKKAVNKEEAIEIIKKYTK